MCYQRRVKTVIATSQAPAAIGPYAQGIAVPTSGKMLFLSGQIPLHPQTMQLVEGDVRAQTRRVLDNLAAVLAAAGAGFEHVVRTTIYLLDLADFAAVNDVYAERFGTTPPARATVQVSRLPRDAKVEIDAIAVIE